MKKPRVMFVSHACYLDSSNGAAVSSREVMQALARRGFAVEVLCGSMLDRDEEFEQADWLRGQGFRFREVDAGTLTIDPSGVRAETPPHFRLSLGGVPITMHRGPTTRPHRPDAIEGREFLALFERSVDRFRPDVIVGYGGSRLSQTVFAKARAWGIATVFELHNFQYRSAEPFANVDAIRVPSQFAADHYREALGLDCTVLPNLVDFDRIRADRREPGYVTFVNPSPEKGVYAFARIADELGRRRPDIPFLVVEARGSEATLVGCGLDLRVHGNIHLMEHTPDAREFWRVSRVCLLPSLWWENQPRVAVEAMINGIPVVGSDRGGIPEVLGNAGLVLPLPDRLTPGTRLLPTAEEVAPWVESILRLWDDSAFYDEHRRRAKAESERWRPKRVEPQYIRFYETRSRSPRPPRPRACEQAASPRRATDSSDPLRQSSP